MATWSSKQYSWCSLSVAFGGRILEGITELEYTIKQYKDYLFGRGCTPHGVVRGNRTGDGKITLWQSEVEAMIRDAKNKDVLALSFDIIASYVPHDGGQIVTDIIKNVEFTEMKKSMKQGDKNMLIELPIIFTKVEYQK